MIFWCATYHFISSVEINNGFSFPVSSKNSEVKSVPTIPGLPYLRRIGGKLSMWTRTMIYNAIIRPHFEYGATVLFQMFQNDINKLQRLQNKAMRCILRCKRETPIEEMLSRLKWLNVTNQIKVLVLVFIFKVRKGLMPVYLTDKLKNVNTVHNINTRSAKTNKVMRRHCKGERWLRSVFNQGAVLYDRLPTDIKIKKNENEFKKKCTEVICEM